MVTVQVLYPCADGNFAHRTKRWPGALAMAWLGPMYAAQYHFGCCHIVIIHGFTIVLET
jgi:hypothetical protein